MTCTGFGFNLEFNSRIVPVNKNTIETGFFIQEATVAVLQISAKELLSKIQQSDEPPLLLDVREPHEYQLARIENSVLIPLGQIQQKLNELDPENETVVICHHGMRSQQVADYLDYCGFKNVSNLVGGIDAWSIECDSTVPRY